MESTLKNKMLFGFIWRFLQNSGSQIISFVIQIILARLLLPEDYSIVALCSVFITIADVFITTGFTSAIIQKQDVNQTDLSSAFYSGVFVSLILYSVLFFAAPFIAVFYKTPLLTAVLRVQSLSVVIASLFSIHQTIVLKTMKFKKSFIVSIASSLIHGLVGIVMAFYGFGVWALVVSTLVSNLTHMVIYFALVKWVPSLEFSFKSVKKLFSFSSKILAIGLINTIYNNIKSLVIGKIYSTTELSYYNRGYQFPNIVMNNVDRTMNTVLFSALAETQDNKNTFMLLTRRSMKISMFFCAPLMFGMIAVAENMVKFLLTDKWLPCVPFIQITCLICLLWPLSSKTQALNALGKSGTSLILNIVSKIIGIIFLVLGTRFNVYIFVLSGLFSSMIMNVINFIAYKKALNYKIAEQISDILPPIIVSLIMFVPVYLLGQLSMPVLLNLIIQITVGVIIYVVLCYIFKLETLRYILNLFKR